MIKNKYTDLLYYVEIIRIECVRVFENMLWGVRWVARFTMVISIGM